MVTQDVVCLKRFVDRQQELRFLDEQYNSASSSLVILYGRRRVGKTSLIREFVRGKPFVYFPASEESELQNMRGLREQIASFTGDALLHRGGVDSWDVLFQTLIKLTENVSNQRLVLVLDEFQYLGKINPAFPSIFQRIWDTFLREENIMVILCGSLINMMEAQALNYSSPFMAAAPDR